MKLFILITAILEVVAGLLMFLAPKKLPGLQEADARSSTLASMYGAAALAIGFFAFQVWQNFESTALVASFLLTFTVFHAGVMAAAFRGSRNGLKDMTGVAILHGLFLLATLFFYFQVMR